MGMCIQISKENYSSLLGSLRRVISVFIASKNDGFFHAIIGIHWKLAVFTVSGIQGPDKSTALASSITVIHQHTRSHVQLGEEKDFTPYPQAT